MLGIMGESPLWDYNHTLIHRFKAEFRPRHPRCCCIGAAGSVDLRTAIVTQSCFNPRCVDIGDFDRLSWIRKAVQHDNEKEFH